MASKGPSQTGASGQPPTAMRTTRASSRQAAHAPPGGSNASPGEKAKKRPTAGEQSRSILADAKCLGSEELITPSTMYKILARILNKYGEGMNSDARVALRALATLLQEVENQEQISARMMDAIARKVESKLETVLDSGMLKMSDMVDSVVANQKDLQEATAKLAGSTEALQKTAQEMGCSAKEASATTEQLANTVTTYKEALLTASNEMPRTGARQTATTNEDPRLTRDLDRRSRQILVEIGKEAVEGKSAVEIKERLENALKNMEPSPPEGAKIQEINKLRNGGVIIQLESKEAADWLREPFNKHAFTGNLDANAFIKERTYPIVVPRVPITFEPANQDHLRKVEGVNNLAPNTICKARWIKPIYRRHPKQLVAHATFTLSSACEANRLIRDGMNICSNRTYPKRLKYEPKQCMKCRKWGHFAAECHAKVDTCGTCGENHVTSECTESEKRYCVACKATDHASWDRSCPEFRRKSAHFDELHPENALTYFPTEESWTLIARPERIPIDERFPSKYTVGSLPPPSQTRRQMPTREVERKQKRRKRSMDSTQRTLDGYIERRTPANQAEAEEGTEEGQNDKDSDDVVNLLDHSLLEPWL